MGVRKSIKANKLTKATSITVHVFRKTPLRAARMPKPIAGSVTSLSLKKTQQQQQQQITSCFFKEQIKYKNVFKGYCVNQRTGPYWHP